jgi:GNAT superfamily N-acetyltransferase
LNVLTYRELESKDGLLPLLDHAFNWIFDERQFNDFARVDPRLKNGPIGFCALEGSRIIGYVGVMDIVTRTLEGTTERVGGLYGVTTLPGFTRRGVFTTLMAAAHEYFKQKDYRFSLLGTSPTLIAHGLYEKLGYKDAVEYPSAYKVVRDKSSNTGLGGLVSTFDPQRMLSIYRKATKTRTGLVIRDIAYLKMLRKVEGIKPKQCLVGGEGYVIFKEDKSTMWVRELIATNKKETETRGSYRANSQSRSLQQGGHGRAAARDLQVQRVPRTGEGLLSYDVQAFESRRLIHTGLRRQVLPNASRLLLAGSTAPLVLLHALPCQTG